MLAGSLAMALDPVQMAARAGVICDPWQQRALRSRAKRQLLNCARQSGKSTVSALKAVRKAVYTPRSLTLCLSPTLRQSGELFRKCAGLYQALGRPCGATSETALSVTLGNGSRIVSLPGKEGTVRSYSAVDLLIVDEASRTVDDLYYSVRPMLAVSNGELLGLSTPFGKRGWWYEAWRSEEEWERYEVPATECPRISAEFLAEERRTVGEWWFRQEYECEFLDAITSVFRGEDIDAAFREEIEPWDLIQPVRLAA